MSLAAFASVYKNAVEKRDTMYMDPPIGTHVCKLVHAEYKEIQKNGQSFDKFTWTLEIVSDALKGARFERVEFLPPDPQKAETKLSYIKGSVSICGITPALNILDLPHSMKQCVGAVLETHVIDTGQKGKDGKPIKNIKFTKCIEQAKQTPDEYFPNDTDILY